MRKGKGETGLPGGPITLEQAADMHQPPMSPRSDAEIQAGIDADPDAEPIMTDAQMAGGSWVIPPNKVLLTLRVDADVLAAYKATGRGWQTRMNEALAASVASPGGTLHSAARQLVQIAAQLRKLEAAK